MSNDGNGAKHWFQRGKDYIESRNYSKAIECFDKALEIDPIGYALTGKGNALLNLGIEEDDPKEYKEAIECFDKALEIDPKDTHPWIGKGNALYKLGFYKEAIKCYDTLLEVKKSNDRVYFYRGQSKYALEDFAGALEDFKSNLMHSRTACKIPILSSTAAQ